MADDFVFYDAKYVPNAHGFANMGATCYFNALTQALLSCSSFNKVASGGRSVIGEAFKEMFRKFPDIEGTDNFRIVNALLSSIKGRKDLSPLQLSNQCCIDTLTLLVEHIKSASVERLFEHRYDSITICDKCSKIATQMIGNINIIFPIPESTTFDGEDIVSFIMRPSGKLVGNYKCPHCGSCEPKTQVERLTMIPEILAIVFQGRKPPKSEAIPEHFSIPCGKGKKYNYSAVAQIEHSGGPQGGHYWAICKRGKWFMMNDSYVSESRFGVTGNTYVLFYHIYDTAVR